MTLTGIAADIRRGNHAAVGRRVLAVVTMFIGAVCGGLLVLHANPSAALGLVVAMLASVLTAIMVASKSPAAWHT